MSLPVTAIYSNYLSIQGGGASVQGMVVPNNFGFGIVDAVGTMVGSVVVGDSVLYSTDNAVPVDYGGDTYIMIKESDIVLIESPYSP